MRDAAIGGAGNQKACFGTKCHHFFKNGIIRGKRGKTGIKIVMFGQPDLALSIIAKLTGFKHPIPPAQVKDCFEP